MKTKKVMAAILAVLLAAGALTGCGNAEQTNGPKKTRVVLNEVAHSLFYAPMYVAIEEGYFADAGIDLELVTGFGADKTMTAVLTGEADIGFMGTRKDAQTPYQQRRTQYVLRPACLRRLRLQSALPLQSGQPGNQVFQLLQLQGQPWHLPIHPLHQGRLSGRSGAGRDSAADQVCQPL